MSTRVRNILAVSLSLALLALAVVLLWPHVKPSQMSDAPGGGPQAGSSTSPPPDYEIRVTPSNLEEVLARAEERIYDKLLSAPEDVRLDGSRAAALAETATDRLRVALAGSFEDWLNHARSIGAEPPSFANTEEREARRRLYEVHAEATRLPPMSLEALEVRPRVWRGSAIANPESPITWWAYPQLRASYPQPPESAAPPDVYEVLIPMKVRPFESEKGKQPALQPALYAFSWRWDSARGQWIPHEMRILMDEQVGGSRHPPF